jgi:hypothetical protein
VPDADFNNNALFIDIDNLHALARTLAVDDFGFLCNSSTLRRIGGRNLTSFFSKCLVLIATYMKPMIGSLQRTTQAWQGDNAGG